MNNPRNQHQQQQQQSRQRKNGKVSGGGRTAAAATTPREVVVDPLDLRAEHEGRGRRGGGKRTVLIVPPSGGGGHKRGRDDASSSDMAAAGGRRSRADAPDRRQQQPRSRSPSPIRRRYDDRGGRTARGRSRSPSPLPRSSSSRLPERRSDDRRDDRWNNHRRADPRRDDRRRDDRRRDDRRSDPPRDTRRWEEDRSDTWDNRRWEEDRADPRDNRRWEEDRADRRRVVSPKEEEDDLPLHPLNPPPLQRTRDGRMYVQQQPTAQQQPLSRPPPIQRTQDGRMYVQQPIARQVAAPPPQHVAEPAASSLEEKRVAACMVRTVLPHWHMNTDERLWAYDPRTACWSPLLVSPFRCTGVCRCAVFPTLSTLTPTLMHNLLPLALPALAAEWEAHNAEKEAVKEKDSDDSSSSDGSDDDSSSDGDSISSDDSDSISSDDACSSSDGDSGAAIVTTEDAAEETVCNNNTLSTSNAIVATEDDAELSSDDDGDSSDSSSSDGSDDDGSGSSSSDGSGSSSSDDDGSSSSDGSSSDGDSSDGDDDEFSHMSSLSGGNKNDDSDDDMAVASSATPTAAGILMMRATAEESAAAHRRGLGRAAGQLAFRDGVLVLRADERVNRFERAGFFPAASVLAALGGGAPWRSTAPVFDHTCAFPFEYEAFRPAEDEERLALLRRVLFDRFWGRDAGDFLAYLASAYTGGARGRLVISSSGPAPPLICLSDDPVRQKSAAAHHAAALARWELHRNTGPQYLERLLASVHGEHEVRLSSGATMTAPPAPHSASHVAPCGYLRFTRSLSAEEAHSWSAARQHQRLLWCRPAESEIVFHESRHQPGQPAFGQAGNRERALATLRKTQNLARVDAPRILQQLLGSSIGGGRNEKGNNPAFGVFLLWPLPSLPVLDGFVQNGGHHRDSADGPKINEWTTPLAACLRTVKHAAWTPDDAARSDDWRQELDAALDATSSPEALRQLRRCWVELVVRSTDDDCWARTRLSGFSVSSLGYPEEEQTAEQVAALLNAPKGGGPEEKAAALRQDTARRGLCASGWAYRLASPAKKNV